MVEPIFSILHPSARPHKWRKVYNAWMEAAKWRVNVEYVLCADERWGFDRAREEDWIPPEFRSVDRIVWNCERRCYVDSVNTAARASTGRVLIVIADDQFPCEEWDEKLFSKIPDRHVLATGSSGIPSILSEYVVQVSTGTPDEHSRRMTVMPILSRARYQRLGYVFYPEYESMYADNDFYEESERDHCIIDATDLMFPHLHPINSKESEFDQVYSVQNRLEAYELGKKVFRKRTKSGVRGGIALALPGDQFAGVWVAKLLDITTHLLRLGWKYGTFINYTSNAGITRHTICAQIRGMAPSFVPDYILWIDDDQVVETGIVDFLIADMEALPDADMVAGWTWIAASGAYFNNPQVSCGRMDLDRGEVSHAEYRSVQTANGVFEVQWTGFPVVLMRTSALEKVGEHPFAHLPCPQSPWGECGEDISFCKRLQDAGGKIYVDSRAFVPHLKLKPLGPTPESKDQIALALAGSAAAD